MAACSICLIHGWNGSYPKKVGRVYMFRASTPNLLYLDAYHRIRVCLCVRLYFVY